MLYTSSGNLPKHQYVFIDGNFLGLQDEILPAVWFGLHSKPGRTWGCTVMLECGAVYRNLPPHSIMFSKTAKRIWNINESQLWDCYGDQFSTLIYDYLNGLDAIAYIHGNKVKCTYLFTAIPVNDGFTLHPSQEKEFMFLRTYEDRLSIQPTNRVVFIDKSFTEEMEIPRLKLSDTVYSCEK